MNWIAFQMLVGDRAKFLGIVVGVAFASLLISHQASTFCGLMLLTTSEIQDINDAPVWVMDPEIKSVSEVKPLRDTDLYRVRGVSGVEWAVRLYKGQARARLPDGKFQQVMLVGLDNATLVGLPDRILVGDPADLRRPDAVFIDERGYRQLFPGEPLRPGRTMEMNDRRAVIVGVVKVGQTFQTFPVIFTLYSRGVAYAPPERKVLSFVLAQPRPGVTPEQMAKRIDAQTGLTALTREQFVWKTINYFMRETGIPFNFGITVFLGFLVGTAVAGQTFYLFTIENLRQFAVLKAMGAGNLKLVWMIVLQALVVGFLGYGLGVGMSAIYGTAVRGASRIAFYMPWQVLAGTGAAVLVICAVASVFSLHKILVVEPAVVFRG